VVEQPSKPLVTAFMPVYNGEAFLESAIESILAQDYEPFEVVVCDDGSTDGTPDILRRYPTVKTVTQENRGRAAACNTAIEASSGEFLAGFDDDDLWPVNRLSMQAAYLVERPELDCVLGRQEWMNPPPWLGRDPVYGDLDGIPLGSAMFRRAVYDTVGGFDPSFRFSEDMDFLVRLREHGLTMEVLPEIVLYRRFHEDQMTADPPETLPLLRSIRQKLERERASDGE
jgi:glycosyltransferase involved in cell wall biosynthesis